MFVRYPHLERYGNTEVQDIEFGTVYIFPKLDGTNASVWKDKEGLHGGSRNRTLTIENDNAGFFSYLLEKEGTSERIRAFLSDYPTYTLYGEWLVPHTIKTYREEAWRRFWIFDVYDREAEKFLHYEDYQPLLENYSLDYIPCVKIFKNPSYENLMYEAQNSSGFMMPEGMKGEGITIKNYSYVNKYNRYAIAKIVLGEFKDKFHAAMGAPVNENRSNALIICEKCVTKTLVEKEYAKIVNEAGSWSTHLIPRLLHTVFYNIVKEELWDCLKHINYGNVNFQELKALTFNRVKEIKPEILSNANNLSNK